MPGSFEPVERVTDSTADISRSPCDGGGQRRAREGVPAWQRRHLRSRVAAVRAG